jgi:actin-related protein 2
MFQSYLVDVEQSGVAGVKSIIIEFHLALSDMLLEMLFSAVQSPAADVRTELYTHIVLSGGSSVYSGLPSRWRRR